MKYFFCLFYFIICSISAQETIETKLLSKIEVKADSIIGIDSFKTLFFIKNNTLIKQREAANLKYSNLQLGNITSANTFNPLKINLFYKAFNTVIILDNRLAEIFKIDFNTLQAYKNVTHVATGSDNTIWIFNQNLQQLELYDYKANNIRAKSLPISSEVIDLTSNYNSCWLLTKDFIYQYNYTGSLISKIENIGFTSIKESDENIILKKENTLYLIPEKSKKIQEINLPNLLINQFLVTNQIVYIYTDEFLYQYQLKSK
jgi:hypothetical protein